MSITINGSGTITGINAGGLPDGSVTADDLATDSVTTAKITDANITAAKLDGGQSGSAPIYGARAWVNFDGTGTIGTNQTIRGSGNVTSVYKNGTGDYTITFTTAMPDTNYILLGTTGATSSGAVTVWPNDNSFARTTSAIKFYTLTTAGAIADAAQVNVAILR